MNLYLGIDGGQSSTAAVIGLESGYVIGRGKGGPSNHVGAYEGRRRLITAVLGALENACREASLDSACVEFESVCMGATGGSVDKEPILREILRVRHLSITDDATIALAGAHAGGPGIITIAGTGSISIGRNSRGEFARAGGWGYALGDEGAAYDIVRQALRASLRFHEGWGPPTVLHNRILEATGARDIHVMRRLFYTDEYPRPRIASFAPLVCQAARDGDVIALGIIEDAVRALVRLTMVVRSQLFGGEDSTVAYVGGMFRDELLRQSFIDRVSSQGISAHPPVRPPEEGALLEAIRVSEQ